MKRICFIGAVNSIHLTKIYEYLVETGKYELIFITLNSDQYVKFQYHNLSVCKKFKKINYFLSYFRVKKIIKKFKPDIIFTQFATGYGFFTYLLSSKPYILRVQGCDVLRLPKTNYIYKFISNKSTQKATKIISVSKDLTKELLRWGINPNKIEEFQNGIDFNYFNMYKRKEHSDDTKSVTILTNREISAIYNYPVILEAFILVLKVFPQLKLKIIADGNDVDFVKNFIKDNNLMDSIIYNASIPNIQMAVELKNADIYISASSTDGTSRSLLEAMSCGAFPIVSDIPANHNFIENGVNGFLFSYDDSNDLASKIISAVNQSEFRKEAANINWIKMQEIGSLDSTMKKVVSIIDSIE